MYISTLRAQNYRCFKDTTVAFQPGLNVIIGENNAGKTALLKALGLVFQRAGRSPIKHHDFYHGEIEDLSIPPAIIVTVILASNDTDTEADLALVATWLTKLEDRWEAELTYRFALSEQYHEEFNERRKGKGNSTAAYWQAVELLLPKYVGRTFAGQADAQLRAEPDALGKFDFQFLDAIRDVESQMHSGRSPLLRRMLGLVIDSKEQHRDPATRDANEREFQTQAGVLMDQVRGRLDLQTLFSLIDDTGASEGGTLGIGGSLTERDLLSALSLLISKPNANLPVTHNGLGYNNLIYVSLVLANARFMGRQHEGDNEKLFPMLVVEEPEAHLHPTLQYRLLKFVREQLEQAKSPSGGSRQVFMSTHSTHITAAAGLDALICLMVDDLGTVQPAYPGQVFADGEEQKSKRYVERYLDATKSNMLFSKGILFVEGIAEQQLVPCFAEYLQRPFENNFATVIAVDGLCFKHFLPLFGASIDSACKAKALKRKVACLVDGDPMRRSKKEGKQWKRCWPYEVNTESSFEYKIVSPVITKLRDQVKEIDNVCIFNGEKTLEYDIARGNLHCPLIVTPSCTHEARLRNLAVNSEVDDETLQSRAGKRIQLALSELAAGDAEAAFGHRFATYYLQSVKGAKGEHAFELERQLRNNLYKVAIERIPFVVPNYIAKAIEWVCPEVET